MRHSDDIKKIVKGFMVESYIEDGSQKVEDGVYGKSITDPCLGWEKTKEMISRIKSGQQIAVFIGPEGGFE